MIKCYCDKCGKETNGTNICDVCAEEELTYGFKIGDKVITADGREGVITHICTCSRCKGRGFYEPTILLDDGDETYITNTEKECGFEEYYQIGDHVFENLDEYNVIAGIERCEQQLAQWRKQLTLVKKLSQEKEKNNGN